MRQGGLPLSLSCDIHSGGWMRHFPRRNSARARYRGTTTGMFGRKGPYVPCMHHSQRSCRCRKWIWMPRPELLHFCKTGNLGRALVQLAVVRGICHVLWPQPCCLPPAYNPTSTHVSIAFGRLRLKFGTMEIFSCSARNSSCVPAG